MMDAAAATLRDGLQVATSVLVLVVVIVPANEDDAIDHLEAQGEDGYQRSVAGKHVSFQSNSG
jgi:hypothetical protein